MTNYEQRLNELNAELIARQDAEKAYHTAREEMNERNIDKLKTYFAESGIEYPLVTFRKEWVHTVDEEEYSFRFRPVANTCWQEFTVNFKVANKVLGSLKSFNYPSNSGTSIDDLTSALRNMADIGECFKNDGNIIAQIIKDDFETMDNFTSDLRDEHEIKMDIENWKDVKIRNDLDIRPGRTLMIDVQGHKSRWGAYWRKVTITKVNKKSVQFVTNYDDGTTSREVDAVPYIIRNFRTIEDHARIEAERKAKRSY